MENPGNLDEDDEEDTLTEQDKIELILMFYSIFGGEKTDLALGYITEDDLYEELEPEPEDEMSIEDEIDLPEIDLADLIEWTTKIDEGTTLKVLLHNNYLSPETVEELREAIAEAAPPEEAPPVAVAAPLAEPEAAPPAEPEAAPAYWRDSKCTIKNSSTTSISSGSIDTKSACGRQCAEGPRWKGPDSPFTPQVQKQSTLLLSTGMRGGGDGLLDTYAPRRSSRQPPPPQVITSLKELQGELKKIHKMISVWDGLIKKCAVMHIWKVKKKIYFKIYI